LAEDVSKAERFLRHLEPLQAALEAYCRRSVYDPNGVLDVLQSAVASTYRDFHLFVEGTNFRAWVFRYVHLEIQNANRKHRRDRHETLPAGLSVEEAWNLALDEPLLQVLLADPDAILDECDTALAQAIWGLAPQERSILLLQAIGEFKYREIAEILQVPVGTVMSGLSRCRLRLRERLVKFGEERGLLRREER
jgi:RNA polymerase sigma-70 factor (ECF subfamily)